MEEHKKVPVVAVVILAVALLGAIAVFVLRKQTVVSPIPEGNDVKVIFTSPPPSDTPAPTDTPMSTPTPSKKPAPTAKPTSQSTPAPSEEPTPTE